MFIFFRNDILIVKTKTRSFEAKPAQPEGRDIGISVTNSSTKTVVIVSIFIILFLAAGVGSGIHFLNRSSSCGFCHEMKPEIATWQQSSHSRIECAECHGAITEDLLSRDGLVKELNLHFQKNYLLPITTAQPVPNSRCLNCHPGKRHVSPSGDLIIPHDKHNSGGISCSECHRGVAHGNIALRQMTIDGNFDRWTPALGKEQMSGVNTGISMTACMECHRIKRVTQNCEACHREIVKPGDHKSPTWTKEHGKLARQDIKSCDKCHSYTVEFELTNLKDPIAEYVQTNTLCWECHRRLPEDHKNEWASRHGTAAKANKASCYVCHNRTRPLNSFKGTKTFCTQCHKGEHMNFIRDVHPIPIPPGTKPDPTCQKCHSIKVCSRCHTTLSSKPKI